MVSGSLNNNYINVRCLLGRSSRLWRLEGRLWAFDFVEVPRQPGQQDLDEFHRILLVLSTKPRRTVFHLRILRCGSTAVKHPYQSPAIIHRPSTINIQHPSITICHPSSIIDQSSSNIHQSPSVIHHPASINHHPTSINHHPSSIIHHPSIAIHHPSSTIPPSSSNIHPSSSIIHQSRNGPESLEHIRWPKKTMAVYWVLLHRISIRKNLANPPAQLKMCGGILPPKKPDITSDHFERIYRNHPSEGRGTCRLKHQGATSAFTYMFAEIVAGQSEEATSTDCGFHTSSSLSRASRRSTVSPQLDRQTNR